MSGENLDLVRSIYAAWERGDYSAVEWAHPQIEYVIVDGPSPGSWTGLAAIANAWQDVLSALEDVRTEAEECRELGNECVLLLTHYGGRGKTSGLGFEQMRAQGANLFHIRDGKVVKLTVYFDRSRAFSDLGLKE
jgi:ketosteroid isomerase-like protein